MASLLIRGFALGFAIAASPGPIFFLCLRRSLLRGWLTGLVSGLGVATADAFYAAIAVFGVAAVVTTTLAPAARWLALAGGLALVFIGIRAVVSTPATREATTNARAGLSGSWTKPALVVAGVGLGSAGWWLILAAITAALRARVTPTVARTIGIVSGLAIAGLGAVAVVASFGQ
ncbi:MAG: LysE family translocator [Chloroflexi bacterium]|nr:MAG: LysE family translocator [Chloroflexota bacterium]